VLVLLSSLNVTRVQVDFVTIIDDTAAIVVTATPFDDLTGALCTCAISPGNLHIKILA
jgi:hypothetical protein